MNILNESEKLEARKIKIREMLEAQEVAFRTKNPKICCMLARSGEKFLNLNKLQKTLIESKNAKYCYLLAKHSEWADVKTLENVVIENGSDYDLYCFACNVKGADVQRISKTLAERKSLKNLIKLCKVMPNKIDVKSAQDYIITSNQMANLFLFAMKVKGADVDLLLDRVIEQRDDYICFKFAVEFPNIDIKKVENALIEWGNPVWCYKMAKYIPGVNKEELIQSIMLKHDVFYAMKSIEIAQGIQKIQLLYFVANSLTPESCQEVLECYDLTERERKIFLNAIQCSQNNIPMEKLTSEEKTNKECEDCRELFY